MQNFCQIHVQMSEIKSSFFFAEISLPEKLFAENIPRNEYALCSNITYQIKVIHEKMHRKLTK